MIPVISFAERPDWDTATLIEIKHYPWGQAEGYQPQAFAKLCFVPSESLFLRMWCLEKNPLTTYFKNDMPVYKDSCLEMFIKTEDSENYVNFEVNSACAILCGLGKDRHKRKSLSALPEFDCKAVPVEIEGGWGFELRIPIGWLTKYLPLQVQSSVRLYANFYKCGDQTPQPHYGCWNYIDAPEPDFHLPAFFGCMQIQ